MDPVTFGLIVTALSGVSAVLGIGQTGFQLFQNRKRVQEVVQEDSFIDLSVIEKRGDRKMIQSIVTELKKAAPQANNIMKDMRRRIIGKALVYTIIWLSIVLFAGWAVASFGSEDNVTIASRSVSTYFVYVAILVFLSVVLLNLFLSRIARKFGLSESAKELIDLNASEIKELVNSYKTRAKDQVEKSFRAFGPLKISEQEQELVERYLNVVSALRTIQAQALLLSLRDTEESALREMENLASRSKSPNQHNCI